MNTLASLGPYTFSVNTAAYTQLQSKREWRWKDLEVLGGWISQQYMGPGNWEIELEGDIFPMMFAGLNQMSMLGNAGDTMQPLALVDSLGRNYGMFLLTSLEHLDTAYLPNGAPRFIHFRLKLKAYGTTRQNGTLSGLGGILGSVGMLGSIAPSLSQFAMPAISAASTVSPAASTMLGGMPVTMAPVSGPMLTGMMGNVTPYSGAYAQRTTSNSGAPPLGAIVNPFGTPSALPMLTPSLP